MMRINRIFFPVSVAALSMLLLPACAQKDEFVDDVTHVVEVTAFKGSAETRALALSDDNKTLTAPWEEGETVEVYRLNYSPSAQPGDNVYVNVGTLTAQSGGYSTTLKGVIRGTFKGGESLMFSYRHGLLIDYRGQKGTLDDIADNYDYATATAYVSDVSSGTLVLSGSLSFTSAQCVIRFALADAEGNPLNASKLTIQSSNGNDEYATNFLLQYVDMSKLDAYNYYCAGPVEVNLSTPSNVIYVALSGADGSYLTSLSSRTISIVATVGEDTYTCVKTPFSFQLNKYYLYDVTLTKPVTDPSVTVDTQGGRYGDAAANETWD